MQYYPLIQLALIAAFLLVAYLVFSSFRRASKTVYGWEWRRKPLINWAPLSSLMAWVELLDSALKAARSTLQCRRNGDASTQLRTASKTGSNPDLARPTSSTPSNQPSRICAHGHKSKISPAPSSQSLFNQSLGWVLENLMRNAVDAMEGKGDIKISLEKTEDGVQIDVADNGKGITKSDARNIFSPGLQRKAWLGIGLSLQRES